MALKRLCPILKKNWASKFPYNTKTSLLRIQSLTKVFKCFVVKKSFPKQENPLSKNPITDPKERNRFLKFAVVGVIGAIVDFGIMNLLTQKAEMSLVWAGTISFISAIISNFIWNRYWTYPESRSRPITRQLAMFFAVNIAGMAIRIPILHFVEPPMKTFFDGLAWQLSLGAEFLAKNFTLALAVGTVMLWNFFVNRYWTYNDIDSTPATQISE